jgi:hypothetical protein
MLYSAESFLAALLYCTILTAAASTLFYCGGHNAYAQHFKNAYWRASHILYLITLHCTAILLYTTGLLQLRSAGAAAQQRCCCCCSKQKEIIRVFVCHVSSHVINGFTNGYWTTDSAASTRQRSGHSTAAHLGCTRRAQTACF